MARRLSNKILVIALKEVGAHFRSPVAYLVLIATFAIFNIFFFMIIDHNREATLRDMFQLMGFMFLFIIPLLTMRTFAEERRTGTIEFLLTCPVRSASVVLGKYMASLAFFSLIILISGTYYIVIEAFSQPDRYAIATGYCGIWLQGALFVAVGILVSSFTRNQLTAALSSYAILFLIYFSIGLTKYLGPDAEGLIRHISFWSHTEHFGRGVVFLSDIVYYFSGIICCLALTHMRVENRT